MNCIIPGVNIKVLAKTLHALAKIGDDLFIEAKSEKLSLYTFNQCKTICVQFHLLDIFFSHFNVIKGSQINYKVQMKALLPLFKGSHLDRKLEYIKLEYHLNSDVIYFKVKYKCDDLIMIHKLHLMVSELLNVNNICQNGKNNICASGNFYNNLLALFSSSTDDITLEFTKDNVIIRNYCLGEPINPKFVRSQVTLSSLEFSLFQINIETTISFSLKPFKAAIQFADILNLNIGIHFDTGGKPLTIITSNPSFEATFVVATLNPNNNGDTALSTVSSPIKTINLTGNNLQKDLEILTNENWKEFSEEEMEDKTGKIANNNNSINQLKNKKNYPKQFIMGNTKQQSWQETYRKAQIIFKRSHEPVYEENTSKVLLPTSDTD